MQELIGPYVDGELDLVNSLELETHLQDCGMCSPVYQNYQAMRRAMSASTLYFNPPGDLQKRVRSSLHRASKDENQSRPYASRQMQWLSWRWASLAAAAVALVIVSAIATGLLTAPAESELLARDVVASHIRSLMADHLTDVPSSDQHTVKPWFNGKLDFSPPVKDLAGDGFPLVGGRLDYLDHRPVAALVYQRRQHLINVFVWPSTPGQEKAESEHAQQGYNALHSISAGVCYWTVSDLNRDELREFVSLLKR
jgi:anti-sigma factor RsiW